MAAIFAAVPSASFAETVYYVDGRGSDKASGLSRADALRTPHQAVALSKASRGQSQIVISGDIWIDRPIRVGHDSGVTAIRSDNRRRASLTARGKVSAAIVVERPNVEITGLTIADFHRDGILIKNVRGAVIRSNIIRRTRSDGWSQAAIHLTGNVSDAVIDRNVVQDADYSGIQIDTSFTSDVSNISITRNIVERTCQVVADCGAIYLNDRARKSSGSVVAGNRIRDYGPASAKGRAIYLDDWASNVRVEQNTIEGRGEIAIQIHGGHSNLIKDNSIELGFGTKAIHYIRHVSSPRWPRMSGNQIVENIFHGRPIGNILTESNLPSAVAPYIRANQNCYLGTCRATSNEG